MARAPGAYVKRLGFLIGGEAENVWRDAPPPRHRDAARVAATVLDIFHDAFGYRGVAPIHAHSSCRSRTARCSACSVRSRQWIL